jgi:hypothetical protein
MKTTFVIVLLVMSFWNNRSEATLYKSDMQAADEGANAIAQQIMYNHQQNEMEESRQKHELEMAKAQEGKPILKKITKKGEWVINNYKFKPIKACEGFAVGSQIVFLKGVDYEDCEEIEAVNVDSGAQCRLKCL